MAILRRTEIALRTMYVVRLIEKKWYSRTDGFVGFGRNFRQASQSEWNAMVWLCFKEG